MRQPGFLHLTGRAMWQRCDHAATRIEGAPARVTLATAEAVRLGISGASAEGPQAELAAWRRAMGAAVLFDCPPDLCDGAATILADPAQGLFALRQGLWASLSPPPTAPPAPDALDFAPILPPPPASTPRAIARDPAGRLWLLEAAEGRLRLLGADLRTAAVLRLAPDAVPIAFGCTRWGLIVADGATPRLFVQAWGGEWQVLTLPAAPRAIAADPRFSTAIIVLAGRKVAIFRGAAGPPGIFSLPALHMPLHAVMLAEDRVLIADVAGTPGVALPTYATEFTLHANGPEADRFFAVRRFDGRALWLGACGTPMASTAEGARPFYARDPALATAGAVETFALDSTVFACVWHRVFVDACVPPGTSVTLEARTSDTLPEEGLRRAPRKPADAAASVSPDHAWPPLGSLVPDEVVGWSPVGLLDSGPAYADTPLPPFQAAIASEDPLKGARGQQNPPPTSMVTLEGVIKAPPGRWLWLRIRLGGTERRAPAIFALRATCPRPSLLDLLPAYWRGDAAAADATDRALALFEGFVTETDARISAIRHLLSAHTAPPEALEWLGGFLALTFDTRIAEPVRRSLLAEVATLWRQRGTIPGLTRLLSILAEAPVQVIEAFRLRRENSAILGAADWGVLGPGLQLGGNEDPEALSAEPWEQKLQQEHLALILRRMAVRAEGNNPCPEADPPMPLDDDPVIAFHRRFAHRFTVVLPRRRTEDLAAVLDLAIETNKPAHTVHALCWLDAGYRLGKGSLVGIARIGAPDGFVPAVLGEAGAPLGAGRTLGVAAAEDRWMVGATRNMRDGSRC